MGFIKTHNCPGDAVVKIGIKQGDHCNFIYNGLRCVTGQLFPNLPVCGLPHFLRQFIHTRATVPTPVSITTSSENWDRAQ